MTSDINSRDDPMSLDISNCNNGEIKHEQNDDGPGTTSSNWNLIKNPSNGRTRISQACDRCRARKIKCSGKSENNPKCTNCEKDGFPCIVSDKLTRNSFPKGYTKNLEKKLLDVELNRNQLLLEIETLKGKISQLESSSSSSPVNATTYSIKQKNKNDIDSPFRSISNNEMTIDSEMINTLSYSHTLNNTNNNCTNNNDIDNDTTKLSKNDTVVHTPKELNLDSIDNSRKQAYFNKQIETNTSGLLIIDQNLKSPFESIFQSLKSNPFKGYKSNGLNDLNTNLSKSTNGNGNSTSSSVSSGSVNSSQVNQNSLNDALVLKSLTTYHMNLNRYLNLILYKLIFPLFNLDAKYSAPSVSAPTSTSASMHSSSSYSSHTSNNTNSESTKNLDHLIWLFFNDYNKLIPILEFELFYNDYLTFVNTYTLKNSTYLDNGEIKKRYYEFNPKDQDTMIKLILILKFTLCQPKINEKNKSSAFLPDKNSLNQLDESIKLINMKHLIMMYRNINFCLSPNLDKLEISLLLFYYLIKFENYNLPHYTDNLHSHKEFLLDVINLNVSLVHTLNVDKPSELLITNKFQEKKLIEIQRLKLYWDFKILIKLSEIYFNIPFIDEDYDSGSYDLKNMPSSLDSIVLVNNDIKITLCLVKLLKLIPWNIMEFVNDQNLDVLKKIDSKLSEWKKAVEDLYNEENSTVFNKLKSYYLYFKVLVNINGKIDSSYFIDFVNLVYDLTFNNPKSSNKSHDISIEAAESLCLHSFNFHLITLISITNLQNNKDKIVSQKIYKLIQLYQFLINYKDVDPLITIFVSYIKENILYSFADASTIQDDTLKLFSSFDLEKSNSGSLFDKKVLNRSKSINYHNNNNNNNNNSNNNNNYNNQNQINFDLNAFTLPGDSNYSIDDVTSSISNKRRKSTASTSSFMSSNVSLASRESSIVSSSRRLSASSNDSMPSLFPSATSPYHNSTNLLNNNANEFSSAKKRIMDYAIQPLRTTMNRSRSLSTDSRIRSVRNDRRLSGSNIISRENSIDPSSSIRNSINNNINNTHINNDEQMINAVDDEILSHILNSDVESEVDSDNMIMNGKSNFRSTNFKPNTKLLPTIPSEGNLMKIMGAMEANTIDPMKKIDFDVDSLFSFGNGLSPNVNIQDATSNSFNNSTKNSQVLPESNILKNNMSDFSKAFKKTPSGSISSAFNSPTTPVTFKSQISKSGLILDDKNLIDDDDLMRLKEHVLNMKSSIH